MRTIEQARMLGITGDAEAEIKRMARLSAPFTHPKANRRYERYVLKVEKGMVTFVGLAPHGNGNAGQGDKRKPGRGGSKP